MTVPRQDNIGGPRWYRGSEAKKGGYKWTCPACGVDQVSPLEQGCPSCGAGTPAQAEQARAAGGAGRITHDQLLTAVVAAETQAAVAGDYFLRLEGLTPKARLSIMAALAHYADHGDLSLEELPRQVLLAWSHDLRRVLLPDL